MSTPDAAPPPPWRRPAFLTLVSLWLLTLTMAAIGVGLFLTALPTASPYPPPITLSWPVLALAFALTEVTVVHLRLRETTHDFSLTELVLVTGLFLADPRDLVLGHLVGIGTMLLIRKRRPVIKLAFNVVQLSLGALLATICFHAIVGDAHPTGPWGWAGALVAVLVVCAGSDLLIFSAISITERRVEWRMVPQMLRMSVPFCVGVAAIALVAVRAFWRDPVSIALLIPPVLLVLVGYRALSVAYRDRSNMAFLHRVSTLLHSQGELEPVLEEFLDESRSTFRADVAELTLLGSGEVTTARSVDSDAPVQWRVLSVEERGRLDDLLALVAGGKLLRTEGAGRGAGFLVTADYARSRGLKDLMAVALEGDRLHGVLLVGHHEGAVTTFDDHDATLLQTLATQVGQVLDNGHLEQSLKQVTMLKEQLAHRANHDHLTGLANRSHVLDCLREALTGPDDGADLHAVSVLYLDLDGFKGVNDSFGHDTGDALLRVVADRLKACVRTGDVVARLGGDEFAVVLAHREDTEDVVVGTAERIRSLVTEPVQLRGHVLSVGTSVGIATTRVPARLTVDELISRADSAMYVAKRAGGSRHVVYSDGLAESTGGTYSGSELLTALEEDQVFLHYQPIIDLATGDLLGAEALARWQHPVDGVVSPDAFVPLAETTGHNARLARHVLRQACHDARSWLELPGSHALFVSINLSATQLADQGLCDDVAAALQEAGLHPRHLMLEITESMLMRDPRTAVETLAELKDLGVLLAIDDFGTGYSSLAYLRHFSVDILKVPREFTSELGTGPDDDAVTRAIIQLSGTLGLRTIAEGIETSEQHSRLTDLGCEWGQGFLFARPLPQEEMRDLVLFSSPPVASLGAAPVVAPPVPAV